jgi:hypothetical protein
MPSEAKGEVNELNQLITPKAASFPITYHILKNTKINEKRKNRYVFLSAVFS